MSRQLYRVQFGKRSPVSLASGTISWPAVPFEEAFPTGNAQGYGSQTGRGLIRKFRIRPSVPRRVAKARGRKPGAATGRAKSAPAPVSAPAIDEPPLPFNTGVLHYDVERDCEAIQT